MDHLFSTNCFGKQAMNLTDFSSLKILIQSDHKKLTFSQQKINFLAITFQSVNWLISNFECGKSEGLVACLLKQFVDTRWSTWVKNGYVGWECSVDFVSYFTFSFVLYLFIIQHGHSSQKCCFWYQIIDSKVYQMHQDDHQWL